MKLDRTRRTSNEQAMNKKINTKQYRTSTWTEQEEQAMNKKIKQ